MRKILKISVPAVILFFLIRTVINQWGEIEDQIVAVNPFLFVSSFFLLAVTYVGGAFFWYKILRAVSFKSSFKECFRVFIISNFGRFIPGVVLHYAARVYLSKDLGLGVKEGIAAVLLEAYYTLGGAFIISLLALPWALKLFGPLWVLPPVTFGLIVIIFATPTRVFMLLTKTPFIRRYLPVVVFKGDLKMHLGLTCISAVLFLLYGLAFYLLSSAFVNNPIWRVFDISGLLSASWIIGFITPVAPGGLGVADLSFAYLLQLVYDFSLASFLVLAFRFNLFLAEGMMFFVVIKFFGINVINAKKEVKR